MLGRNLLNSAPLNGDFTLEGEGTIPGALYLDIPYAYPDLLDEIAGQDLPAGMGGSPSVYRNHATNVWRSFNGAARPGGGTFTSNAEGRWCAWSQPYLRVDLDGPSACTLAFTLDGYTFVHSDNHLTDSTRQTTYSYVATPFSYQYELAYDPDEDYNYVCLTLPTGTFDPDLELVGRVTISGFSDGDWTVREPYWSPDTLSTVAPVLKCFESPEDEYGNGGLSAAHDSASRTALCDADEDNAGHRPVVEKRTVRMFDFLQGVGESPQDLTTADTAAAMAARITALSDAWPTTISTSEYENATKDADDSYLSSMYSFDICHPLDAAIPLLQDISGGVNASLRCGQWTIAPGVLCSIRPDKVIGGAMHGLLSSGSQLVRENQGQSVWWRAAGSEDEWTELNQPTSNNAGYWRSTNGKIYTTHDPASILRDYAVGMSAVGPTPTGRWATREYDIAQLKLLTGANAIWMLFVPESRILLFFYESAETIYHIFSNSERSYWEGGDGNTPYTNPHQDVSGTSPSAYRDLRHGQIALNYISGGNAKIALSNDWGENWEAAVSIDLGVSVERSSVWSDEDSGISHVVAVDTSGNIIHAMSSDNFATLLGDVNTVTTGQADVWPTGYTQRGPGGHGVIYVGFADTEGNPVQYSSNDLGSTWNEVA